MEVDRWRTPEVELGVVIGRGRDVTIHDAGRGRVLRRGASGGELRTEAAVMAHVATAGYPVPRVHRVGDGEMEMDRVLGPTMLDDLGRRPWRVGAHAVTLADLHRRLGEISPPGGVGLRPLAGAGRVLCHGDLHPANVMVTPDGPVVIDWTNVLIGPPGFDAADAWLVLGAARVDAGPVLRAGVRVLRRALLRRFLAGVDRTAARQALAVALDRRLHDANIGAAERSAMKAIVADEERTER